MNVFLAILAALGILAALYVLSVFTAVAAIVFGRRHGLSDEETAQAIAEGARRMWFPW